MPTVEWSMSTPDSLPIERDVLLIDTLLPDSDATLRVSVVVDAPVDVTWQALEAMDLMRVRTPLTAAAFAVRGLADRLARARRGAPPEKAPERLSLDDGLPGWSILGRQPGHELVIGAIGRFWTSEITWRDPVEPDVFAGFREPGWGRVAASFSLHPYGSDRTLLTYDVRTAVDDAESRRRFLRYWRLIRPFVAHIMRATASMVATDAAELRSGRTS